MGVKVTFGVRVELRARVIDCEGVRDERASERRVKSFVILPTRSGD